jgi:hypothetical protein
MPQTVNMLNFSFYFSIWASIGIVIMKREREKVRGSHIYLSAGDSIRGHLQAWTWHRLTPAQVPRVTFWKLLMANEANI